MRGRKAEVAGRPRAAAVVSLLAFSALLGAVIAGCDWFEAQPDVNLPPETVILRCGPPGGVIAGGDVTLVFAGEDFDGYVAGYQYSYDKLGWMDAVAESAVITNVAAGNHTFEVRAYDNRTDVDPSPASCTFAAGELVARTVLAEMLTTNTCRNCPTSEAALDQMLADYGERLTVVAYHDLTATDGLATDETVARIDWYTDDPAIPEDQWPIVIFDGLRTVEGAVSVEQAASEYAFEIGQRLAAGSPVRLSLAGEIGPDAGNVTAGVKVTGILSGHPLVMRMVLIEDDVRYNGYFAKIYDAVARDLLEEEPLALTAMGDSVAVERSFPVEEGWALDKLDLIAFIQDTGTREVIQSARLRHE